jgi:hypothetical protein
MANIILGLLDNGCLTCFVEPYSDALQSAAARRLLRLGGGGAHYFSAAAWRLNIVISGPSVANQLPSENEFERTTLGKADAWKGGDCSKVNGQYS